MVSNFQPTVLYMLKSYPRREGASAIAGKPAQSRSTQPASQAFPKAFEADGIEGVGLHPVRWMKDEIAQSILGRKAQNAQPTHLPPPNIYPPHFHIPSLPLPPSLILFFSSGMSFRLLFIAHLCHLHTSLTCTSSLRLLFEFEAIGVMTERGKTKFTPLRPF